MINIAKLASSLEEPLKRLQERETAKFQLYLKDIETEIVYNTKEKGLHLEAIYTNGIRSNFKVKINEKEFVLTTTMFEEDEDLILRIKKLI